jgi:hypothetical protein
MEKMQAKLNKVRKRRYIAYDVSAVSDLNDSIWVPRFPLPTIRTYLRAVKKEHSCPI